MALKNVFLKNYIILLQYNLQPTICKSPFCNYITSYKLYSIIREVHTLTYMLHLNTNTGF
jgi:hypothetical protein